MHGTDENSGVCDERTVVRIRRGCGDDVSGTEQRASGGDEAPLEQRLAYFRLGSQELQRLKKVGEQFEAYLPGFVDFFYAHLQSFPETARFLRDPELVARLKQAQQQYFRSLFEGSVDASLVAYRHLIGRKHAETGLAPVWFLGAYALYLEFCVRQLVEAGLSRDKADLLVALVKFILFDISLTLDAYFQRATEQIRLALQMLQESNAELKDFARLVSHDLRTPIATVMGLCEEFLDEYGERVPAQARELIEEARAQTRRLAHLLHELTSISQASGNLAARELVSPRALLDEVIDRLRAEIETKGVRVEIDDDLPRVCVHPGRFREIFYQLLSNAVKFSEGEAPTVRVYAKRGDQAHTFFVCDNGPGVPQDVLDLVFLPFWRMPRHRDVPGTGLGLYFVKTMVEEQGGHVELRTRPEGGTCAVVTLPAAKAPQPTTLWPQAATE